MLYVIIIMQQKKIKILLLSLYRILKIKILFDSLVDIVKIQAFIYPLLIALFCMIACVVFSILGAVEVLGKELA